jgi:lipoprotein-releasing system permease protein
MTMSFTSFIAGRYLRSSRNAGFFSFIAAMATLGVALGTATLIIALAVLGGFEREITEKVVGFTSHVEILAFQNLPLKNAATNAPLIERTFRAVESACAFVSREALIRSREGIDGVLLKGLDPERDNSSTPRYIVAGTYDLRHRRGEPAPLVIGKKLASRLALGIGDKAILFGIGRVMEAGSARAAQFRVTGIYESGMSEYDDVYVFSSLTDAQSLFQMGEGVSGYDIRLRQVDSAAAVAEQVQDLLGYPHFGRTVFETYRNLFSWIELQKKPIPLILGLIIIVATVNIIGTLLMMVLDKTREIGVLAAMGATRWAVTKIFLRQGFIIAVLGTAMGNAFALGLCLAQVQFRFFSLPSDIYFMTAVPILLRASDFALVSVITVGLCVLSSLIPARLAARLHPVQAIRFS